MTIYLLLFPALVVPVAHPVFLLSYHMFPLHNYSLSSIHPSILYAITKHRYYYPSKAFLAQILFLFLNFLACMNAWLANKHSS